MSRDDDLLTASFSSAVKPVRSTNRLRETTQGELSEEAREVARKLAQREARQPSGTVAPKGISARMNSGSMWPED